MVATTTLLTADEYRATGDERPRFSELVDGVVIVNTPNLRHQRIAARLRFLLQLWCEQAPARGESPDPVDARLDSGNVFAPDVWWVNEAHRPAVDAAHLNGPPDLAVEVRSPSTWRFDIGAIRKTYERSGLPELWLVDTSSDTILVYRRSRLDVGRFDVALEVGRESASRHPSWTDFKSTSAHCSIGSPTRRRRDGRHAGTAVVCITVVCMNVDRFSVTMDPELGHAVRDAARRSGISVSAWVAQATADKLRNDLLGAALDEWEAADGAFTEAELNAAARALGIKRSKAVKVA